VIEKLVVSPSAFIVYLGLDKSDEIKYDNYCNIWPFFTNDLDKSPVLSSDDILTNNTFLTMISFPSHHAPQTCEYNKMTVGLFAIVKYENHVFWSRNRETFGDNLIAQAEKIIPNLKTILKLKLQPLL